jgi:dienelactone hydrolase
MIWRFIHHFKVVLSILWIATIGDHCYGSRPVQKLEFKIPVKGGTIYLYSDSYAQPDNDCKNSLEFLPEGFNFSDTVQKYPVIIYFAGLGEQWQYYDAFKPKLIDINEHRYESGNPSVVKLMRHPLPNYIFRKKEGLKLSYNKDSTEYKFMVLSIQCLRTTQVADYDKFIENYFFVKYKDKIDFSRVYLTGMSIGGGRALEYLADSARAMKIAGTVPIAMGSECPYTPTFRAGLTDREQVTCDDTTSNGGYHGILTNLVMNPQIGVGFFHGETDEAVPVSVPKTYVAELNRRSGDPKRATGIFPFGGMHNDSWPRAFDDKNMEFEKSTQNLYRWLLNFKNHKAPGPLPVRSLVVQSAGNIEMITWETPTERNIAHFEIQRSLDGTNFLAIGKMIARGNTCQRSRYEFLYKQPNKAAYYRILMISKDGTASYSPTAKVTAGH